MTDNRFPDVMVLAAGLGLCLRPLTENTPKPLIRIAGTPLIDRVIANAHAEGATRFVVNAHYHADQIKVHIAALEAAFAGTRFELSLEDGAPLGTGGGIKRALPLLQTDPFLVMNSDSFWPSGRDRPLRRMIAHFDPERADMVLLCVHPRDAIGFRRSHDFCLDPRGRITKDTGAPIIYAGVALVGRELFVGIKDNMFSFYDLMERSLDSGRLAGIALGTPWFHVGDPQSAVQAAELLVQ